MGNVELMKRSKAVADLAWAAVQVSDPRLPGASVRHADVAEGDHRYAQGLLNGNATAREYGGVPVDPDLIKAANDLVDFFQNHVGWENPPPSSNRASFSDVDLGIASMIQYQNHIREGQMGVIGERAEAGMEKLLLNFAGSYPISQPEGSIEIIREKLDPLFEDGLRLSDHQRMSGGFAPNDPQLDQLARQIVGTQQATERATDMEQRDGRLSRQPAPAPAVRSGPRADDPWEMHP